MRVRHRPSITGPNGQEQFVLVHPEETFTPESLIAEREVLREKFGVMVDIRANLHNVGFRLRSYDRDVRYIGLDQHEFAYAVDATAETPEVLFVSSKGGALDPKQPLSSRTVADYLSVLSMQSGEWNIFYEEPYLRVYSGRDLGGSAAEYWLKPKYKRAHVGLNITVRRGYVDTMTMWVEAVDAPDFDNESAKALVFAKDFQQNDHQATARLAGKPWLEQFSAFLMDFLNKATAWQFTLKFAHALGYHPVDNKFTLTFDDRHTMTYVPPAVSDRS